MTIEERLIALRRDGWTPELAHAEKRKLDKEDPRFWVANALAFDWYRKPHPYAVSSFKYAERLRRAA